MRFSLFVMDFCALSAWGERYLLSYTYVRHWGTESVCVLHRRTRFMYLLQGVRSNWTCVMDAHMRLCSAR